MTAICEKAISDRLRSSPCGTSAIFIKLDDKKGLKLYRSASDRDHHYNQHKEVADKTDLVPRIYEKVDVANYFGYLTEVATPLVDAPSRESRDDRWGGAFDRYMDDCNKAWSVWADEVDRTNDELRKAGIAIYDQFAANYGILNNRVVPIDFGSIGWI